MSAEALYSPQLLDHARRPRFTRGPPAGWTIRGTAGVPGCADHVELFVVAHAGRIVDVGAVVQGCLVAQAAASALAGTLRGRAVGEAAAMAEPAALLAQIRAQVPAGRMACVAVAGLALQAGLRGG